MSSASWLRAIGLVSAAVLLALSLLSVRQARLQAAHELTRARLRVAEIDRKMLDVRGEIARSLTPETLREQLEPIMLRTEEAGKDESP